MRSFHYKLRYNRGLPTSNSTLMLKQTHTLPLILISLSFLIRILCIGSTDLLVEETYYWNYAAHLDIGYLDHPPMVAVLIKVFTTLLGVNEFGVRFASIFCGIISAFFMFQLAQLIKRGSGLYAVLLFSILPFFFIHSLVITPDTPLMVCWSAALYYLYRALILNKAYSWYMAGVWLGLGLLSKYSIVLLGSATLFYVILTPDARHWLLRKEPFFCALIALLLFTPVIYWNASHDWASFVFQTSRRLKAVNTFSCHELLGLLVVFLTPMGVLGFFALFRHQTRTKVPLIDAPTQRFIEVFTLIPLSVFLIFSLTHAIKFNWIGPCLLALIPWLAAQLQDASRSLKRNWVITAVSLLVIYSALLGCIITGQPKTVNRWLFIKYINWEDLTQQIQGVAHNLEQQTQTHPLLMALDTYNIASELSFYQAKGLAQNNITNAYTIIGSDFFGRNSLMYAYWAERKPTSGKWCVLISEHLSDFTTPEVIKRMRAISAPTKIWAHSQGLRTPVKEYYYQIGKTA
jgi:4-amino-4-deoxy-L-arabinose transferase-like glycosyltransferase